MTSTQTTDGEKTITRDIYGRYFEITEEMIKTPMFLITIPFQVQRRIDGKWEWVGNQAWNDLTTKLGWTLPLRVETH